MDFTNLRPIEISEIDQIEFPEDQYYREKWSKQQIVLHHTVSGPNIDGVISTWKGDAQRVATCVVIGRDGVCHQLFSSKYWAHHLGVKINAFSKMRLTDNGNRNLELNQHSIGIELINWGALTKSGGIMTNCYGNKVNTEITEYPDLYQGFRFFESYSEPQLNTLGSLLMYFNKNYNIPLEYNADMFQPSLKAVRGVPGVWSHTSYRSDKSDVHPDPNLIDMLQSLTS